MRAREKRHYGRSAAVTILVAAAVALLGITAPQVRLALGLEPTSAAPTPDRAAVEVTEDRTAGAAPAPPQSFSRPADESRPFVPPSAPRLLEVPSIGLAADVTPYTPAEVAAHGGAVKPATLWDVAWWTGGGTPGSHAENTVYLYGHTWKEPAVFNRVKELERGDAVHVTTRAGRLRYVVDRSFTVLKTDLTKTPTVAAAVPGRLLLLACYRETGREEHTTRNVVVIAHLA